jgi:uncharacterized protein YqfA (UPF0365 family)
VNGNDVFLIIAVAMLLVFVGFLVVLFSLLAPFVRGLLGGAPVPLLGLVGMRLRGNPPGLLVDTFLALRHRGAAVTIEQVEQA